MASSKQNLNVHFQSLPQVGKSHSHSAIGQYSFHCHLCIGEAVAFPDFHLVKWWRCLLAKNDFNNFEKKEEKEKEEEEEEEEEQEEEGEEETDFC